MSSAEFVEWKAFYSMDPWGEQRADLRMAQIAWAAMAPHVKQPPKPSSFLLFPEAEEEAEVDEDALWDKLDRALDSADRANARTARLGEH